MTWNKNIAQAAQEASLSPLSDYYLECHLPPLCDLGTLQQTALSTRDCDVQVWQPSYILVQMPLDMWQWTRWSATGGYVSHTGCFYASLTWSGWVSRSSRSMSEVSRSITAGPFVYLKTADKSSYRGRALVTQMKPYLLDIPPTRSSTFCDCFLLVAVLFILPLLYIVSLISQFVSHQIIRTPITSQNKPFLCHWEFSH